LGSSKKAQQAAVFFHLEARVKLREGIPSFKRVYSEKEAPSPLT
jgi:hypothetical protein